MGSTALGFPRSARLLNGADYARVFEKAERFSDRYFTLLWRPNDQCGSRLGLAVSKKNCRRAVDRNRIKRLIRESFRRRRPDLPAVDVVVLTRRGVADADRIALHASLDRHWRRLIEKRGTER